METWFLASDVLLLVAGCVYMALSRADEVGGGGGNLDGAGGDNTDAKLIIEIIMLSGLGGGLLVAFMLIVVDGHRTRQLLLKMDLTSVLVSAQDKLDGPIRERLLDSTILLLRCDWLISPSSDEKLGKDPATGNPIIKRRQDMPPEAYFAPEEAEALFSSGTRSVLVLSYGWATGPHSDPSGHTLEMVRRYLRSDAVNLSALVFRC